MINKKRTAIYPGSFDPITNGHIDIIRRALKIFDKIIVLIAINPEKKSIFDIHTRIKLIKEATNNLKNKNIIVDSTDGFTIDYAKKHNATAIIRGIRNTNDFLYELSFNNFNKSLNKNIEIVFLMSELKTSIISSSTIIELYKSNININNLVPKNVLNKIKEKITTNNNKKNS